MNDKRFFLTIVDDFSRFTWVYLLKFKSETCVLVQQFLAYVKTQFDKTVKVVRTDNGAEFVNSVCDELFKASGIMHQTTCAYTPQQNGEAERKHKHILEVTRALRFQAGIPIHLWGYCVLAAVYIINRLPNSFLAYQTPYKRLHGKVPSYNHLRVIGCLCYAKLVNEHDKLMTRAKSIVLLGYSEVQKGYVLYDMVNKMVLVSRNVSFREDVFPFKQQNSQADNTQHVFPIESSQVIFSDAQGHMPSNSSHLLQQHEARVPQDQPEESVNMPNEVLPVEPVLVQDQRR